MSKCCIIGGTGFIGSALVNNLLTLGRDVAVISPHPPLHQLSNGAEYIQNDCSDKNKLFDIFSHFEEIIDLSYSTIPQTSFENPIYDIESNLPRSINIFEAASRASVQKFVLISSGGTVYGDSQQLPISEDCPTNPISPYGITKLAIEKYGYMYQLQKGLPLICIRPANAYGEGQLPFRGQGFVATAICSILSDKEVTIYGKQGTVRDYIYIQDLVKGITSALNNGKIGSIYNLGCGIGKSNSDILKLLEEYAQADNLLIKINHLPERLFDVSINILDCQKITHDTHWQPNTTLNEGLKKTWQWYKNNSMKEWFID